MTSDHLGRSLGSPTGGRSERRRHRPRSLQNSGGFEAIPSQGSQLDAASIWGDPAASLVLGCGSFEGSIDSKNGARERDTVGAGVPHPALTGVFGPLARVRAHATHADTCARRAAAGATMAKYLEIREVGSWPCPELADGAHVHARQEPHNNNMLRDRCTLAHAVCTGPRRRRARSQVSPQDRSSERWSA